MHRKSLIGRFASHLVDRPTTLRPACFPARVEPLEERRLLSANSNLLVATFDDSAGSSVLRYDNTTHLAISGGVATGNNGLGAAEGLAVAPDGSFYVSSDATAQVLHYSNSGTFLNVLGGNDMTQAPIFAPGTLAFGPNGHLYVADLGADAIYQFDTSSLTQQYVAADTLSLGYTPGGFTFAGNGDLIVGNLNNGPVTQYHNNIATATLVAGGSGINPASILREANDNLLIADLALENNAMDHHQIMLYNATSGLTTSFITLTQPVSTGTNPGLPPQPTSLLLDQDGNLLVGLSPDHNDNGAIEKFDITTGAYLATRVSGIGTPSGLAFIPPVPSTVVGRDLFYNQSKFDGNTAGVSSSDDAAIAPDKTALLPGGGTATFANLSSYSKGINGIDVDISGAHGTISASDFTFKIGANNTPSTWATAPAPTTVSLRAGAGASGSDRVELIWANNAIQNTWLEVTVLADPDTGLASSDIFFFGNHVGDTGLGNSASFSVTSATDEVAARNNQGINQPITSVYDFDRNGIVNATDQLISRDNAGSLRFINIANPPAAPSASPAGDSGVASGLAALGSGPTGSKTGLPAWASLVGKIDLNGSPVGTILQQLAKEDTRLTRSILVAVDKVADELGVDDDLLDSLLLDLGLE